MDAGNGQVWPTGPAKSSLFLRPLRPVSQRARRGFLGYGSDVTAGLDLLLATPVFRYVVPFNLNQSSEVTPCRLLRKRIARSASMV